MNIVLLILILWSIIPIIYSFWAMSIIPEDCKDPDLFFNIRVLLVSGCVVFILFLSNFLCKEICYKNSQEKDKLLLIIPILSMALCLINFIVGGKLIKLVSGCLQDKEKSGSFETGIIYSLIIPSIFIFLYSCYSIYTYLKKSKQTVDKAIKKRKKKADEKERERLNKEVAEKAIQLREKLDEAKYEKEKAQQEAAEMEEDRRTRAS